MKNILEYLEQTAENHPDKIGFTDEQRDVTFSELMQNAQRIAGSLAKIGCRKPVAVLIDRNVKCIESMFAAVYAGNFYVVIDVHSPEARIRSILETLHPAAIITDKEWLPLAQTLAGAAFAELIILYEDAVLREIDREHLSRIREQMIDTDPLYVLFTSGSSGTPKGTVLSHRSVISYTRWVSQQFEFNTETVFGSQTPLYFSMSVTDLFSTIKCGSTYHLIPKAYFTFPMKLVEFLDQRQVNTIYWVPSALAIVSNWNVFAFAKPKHLKTVLFAGEVMPVKHLNYWRRHLPDCLYANLFGPTETTDICSFYVVDRDFADSESLPIGRACDNCDTFLLTEEGTRATQAGEEGEIVVRGSFLADGYYNEPEKTAAAFAQNPLNTAYPERIYRTGDLARINEKGEFIYISRKDFQIKRMGYRIELGEIEAAAGSFEKVKSAAALYDADAGRILVVYEGSVKDTQEVLQKTADKVPPYMRPDEVIRIKQMPYNANGKIDRQRLLKEYC